MFRIDSTGVAAAPPAIEAVGATVGYFTEGNPATSTPATEVSADWLNSVQEELIAILAAAGISPDKTDRDQVLEAIRLIQQNESETKFTIANNQVGAANVTGFLFAGASFRAVVIEGAIYRKDAGEERSTLVKITLLHKTVAGSWDILVDEVSGAALSGVTFSVTGAGQLQYVSDDMAGGSYVGEFTAKIKRFKV